MIVAVVNFPLPEGISLAEYTESMKTNISRYQGLDGLLRKNYLFDPDRHLGGAVYVWQSRRQAEACYSPEFVERITAAYGPPQIQYFETPILVDNEANRVVDLTAKA